MVISEPINPALVTVVSPPAGCTYADGTVTCHAGTLADGESRSYTVTVQVNPA